MKTSTVSYIDPLRTEATHLRSGSRIITDAPVDNQGRGEAFSPTDLLATSLASCMMTIMGIEAARMQLAPPRMEVSVNKIMAANPRRVSAVELEVQMDCPGSTAEQRAQLEHAGRHCPVALSLHPDLQQRITFSWAQD